MSDPSGRVIPIEFGRMLSPAVCGVCRRTGTDNQEVFADPQVYEEFIGNLYICNSCGTAIVDIFGGIPREKYAALLQQVQELLDNNVLLTSKNARLENLVDTLTRDRLVDRGSDLIGVTDLPGEPINFGLSESGSGTEEPEPKSDESVTGSEHSDISGLTGDNLAGILSGLGI